MNKAGVPAMRKDPFAKLVLALLKPCDGTGGWVRIEVLADECGVAKSTIRRQLDALEAAGFRIEHHIDSGVARRHCLGIRSLIVAQQREPDPDPARWSTREAVPKSRAFARREQHPWRQSIASHRAAHATQSSLQ